MDTDRTFGLHKLLTLKTSNTACLIDVTAFMDFSDHIIEKYGMEKVGIATHVFDTSGFTAAICLRESHICVHTWPELNSLTMDIYLCNYQRNNEQKVRDIGNEYVQFFESQIVNQYEINR